ncbi:N-acetylmuramoyl-L-alanine amidase [Priestia sp. TSO9]|uniref:N-acetylmuramoyl-L-alanine amidase n=1 Tax=Priestia sp. TSO9 TaxID=2885632 RepID=UPI001E32B4EA|nr:N-acetylmuramoyl-L-alanine amidase [Priestia sp. TSO9]
MKRLTIDAGHGGEDPGAVSDKLREKDITLKIALYAEEFLRKNFEVLIKMTRSNDVFVSLNERARIANRFKSDLFVSIHVNAAANGTGFESYIYPETKQKTREFQKALHSEITATINKHRNIKDRGLKTAHYLVLKKTSMPAVLTENLFIDLDGDLLAKEEFLKEIGEAHAKGIMNFLDSM